MDQKIAVSEYVFFGLIMRDFIACLAGNLIRVVFDWFNAVVKIQAAGDRFSYGYYLRNHYPKIVVSFISSFALLVFLPALMVHGGEIFTDKKYEWDSSFSGIVGLLGFELVKLLIKLGKAAQLRALRLAGDGVDVSPPAAHPPKPQQAPLAQGMETDLYSQDIYNQIPPQL